MEKVWQATSVWLCTYVVEKVSLWEVVVEETWKVAVEKYCGMVTDKAVETMVWTAKANVAV